MNVRQWLENNRLGQYSEIFESSGISAESLLTLTDQDLQKYGITSAGDRTQILDAVRSLEPIHLVEIANLYQQRADRVWDRDQGLLARNWYEKALQIRERLANSDPGNLEHLEKLIVIYGALSELAHEGDLPNARFWYEKQIGIANRLTELQPSNAYYSILLSDAYQRVGHLDFFAALKSGADPEEARASYRAAMTIRQQLAESHPNNLPILRRLGHSFQGLGDLESRHDASARDWYEKAVAIWERLIELEPDNLSYLAQLSDSYADLAACANIWGVNGCRGTASARDWYDKCREVRERLVERKPDDRTLVAQLATVYHELGDADEELRGSAAGRIWLEKSLAIRERLVAAAPGDGELLQDLLESYQTLAELEEKAKGPEAARRWREKVLDVAERLLAAGESDPDFLSDLSLAYKWLADLDARSDPETARQRYAKQRDICERLLDVDPDNQKFLRRLSVCNKRLGDLEASRNPEASRRAYGKQQEIDLRLAQAEHRGGGGDRQASLLECIRSHLNLISLVLMVPAILGAEWGGFATLMFYVGGVLFLRNYRPIWRRIRLLGFVLPEHVISLASYVFPLGALAVVTTFHGESSGLIWSAAFVGLVVVLYLAMPPAFLLKELYGGFERNTAPDTKIPILLLGFPADQRPQVPPSFVAFLQFLVSKEGRRYIGLTESARTEQEVQRMLSPGLATLPSDDDRTARLSVRLEDIDRSRGLLHVYRKFWREVSPGFMSLLFEVQTRQLGFVLVSYAQARTKDERFASYVVNHAAGALTLPSGGPSVSKGLQALKYFANAEDEKLEHLLAQEGMSDTALSPDSPLLWKRLGIAETPWAQAVPGPWFVLTPSTTGFPESLEGFIPVSVLGMRVWGNSARRVADLVAQHAVPGAVSAAGLELEARALVGTLARAGLAPVADAYSRFRMSGSAVERFLNLFDCFEVLIKYSYFLAASRAGTLAASMEAVPEVLQRPSLGHWVGLLREQLAQAEPAEQNDPVDDPIRRYWRHELLGAAPRLLVEAANGVGLAWQEKVPRSHLGWLDWLVWLRNKTKGHGGTTEVTALPVWHQFHAAFLDAVLGLREMVVDSVLMRKDEAEVRPMVGWIRGPFRTTFRGDESALKDRRAGWGSIRTRDAHYPLFPFVRFEGERCLTWNSGKGSRAEYIDYATGKVFRIKVAAEFLASPEEVTAEP